jgi:hypothetical protein
MRLFSFSFFRLISNTHKFVYYNNAIIQILAKKTTIRPSAEVAAALLGQSQSYQRDLLLKAGNIGSGMLCIAYQQVFHI